MIDDAVSMAFVSASNPFDPFKLTPAVHLRRFTRHLLDEVRANAGTVPRLMQIAAGDAPRTEDDVFVPHWQFMASTQCWHEIQKQTRECLRQFRVKGKHGYPDSDQLCDELCHLNQPRINVVVQGLIKSRNQRSHGYTPTEDACDAEFLALLASVEELRNLLSYLSSHLLFFVDSISRKRNQWTMSIRMLVHDNEMFERQVFERRTGAAFVHVHEQEVYVQYADPDLVIPLYPWLLFRQPKNSDRKVIWVFDGVTKQKIIYKSAQLPLTELELEEPRDHLRDLAGI